MAPPAGSQARAAFVIQKFAYTLVLKVHSKCSVVMSSNFLVAIWRAALLTRMSVTASALAASATSFWQNASSRMSPGSGTALRPANASNTCASAGQLAPLVAAQVAQPRDSRAGLLV